MNVVGKYLIIPNQKTSDRRSLLNAHSLINPNTIRSDVSQVLFQYICLGIVFFFSLFALDNISQDNLATVYKSDNYLLQNSSVLQERAKTNTYDSLLTLTCYSP